MAKLTSTTRWTQNGLEQLAEDFNDIACWFRPNRWAPKKPYHAIGLAEGKLKLHEPFEALRYRKV